jgi:TetR/AcrR family fatty acid metabolism transcriptional regulator
MKKDKSELIISAASTLFLKEGYFSTTTKRIAKECHLAEGTLYRYFENKDDLFYQVLCRFHGEFMGHLKRAIHPTRPTEENLTALVRVHVEHVKDQPEVHNLFQRDARYLHNNQQLQLGHLIDSLIDLIADVFDWGKGRGEVKSSVDSRDVAYMYFGAFDMILMKVRAEVSLGLPADFELPVRAIVPLILQGIATK